MNKYSKGVLTGVLSVLFLSSYSIFGKILLENLAPETVAGLAQTLSVITILLCFGFLPEIKKIHRLPRKTLFYLFLVAFLAGAVAPLLFLKGLLLTTATNSIIIGRIEVVFVGIISFLWLREKITKNQIGGIALMFIGMLLIATQNFAIGFNFNHGDILIMGSALVWALATVIFKKNLHHMSPELVVLIRNFTGAICMFFVIPLILNVEHTVNLTLLDQNILIPLVLFALLTIVFGQMLWYKTLDLIPATVASSIGLLGPLFGVILAVTILKENLYSYHLIGGIFILIGLALTVLHHQKHPHHHKLQKTKHWTH
ncbi:DMT family transporter [Candidatus Peregrinibacteria bacterium]|jgi:drug/metabolite transporter (DMT)-like permease|nr:DMT family transporter [Candidatus Peregrinibacteria bacterium]MBT7483885.1 DMT family transporter [Candidatus Peregrinibacteria bacterium]MBT7702680.1 DMT family transporter [Candidatus Peregrinibacteria bacterium]